MGLYHSAIWNRLRVSLEIYLKHLYENKDRKAIYRSKRRVEHWQYKLEKQNKENSSVLGQFDVE